VPIPEVQVKDEPELVRCSCKGSRRHSSSLDEPVGDEIEIESPSMPRMNNVTVQTFIALRVQASGYIGGQRARLRLCCEHCVFRDISRKDVRPRQRDAQAGTSLVFDSYRKNDKRSTLSDDSSRKRYYDQ